MNLTLTNITDKGTTKERLILKALVDLDIGRFAIFRGEKSATGITNKVYNTYWFPDKQVKAGDLIILYTGKGVSSSRISANGNEYHFFYWGLSSPIWNLRSVATVLVSVPEWKVF